MKTSRIICMLLVSVMLFSLCSCSSIFLTLTNSIGIGSHGSEYISVSEKTDSTDNTEKVTEKKSEKSISVGKTVGNTYENEYFGIGITLGDNWVFRTQDEINEVNGIVKDVLDSDAYEKALENGNVYTDMFAVADDGMITLNTGIEKLNAINALTVDEEKYIDLTMDSNDFKTIFKDMGIDVSKIEKGSVTIAGEEHPCVIIEGSIQGIGFYEKLASIKNVNYVLTVGISSIGDNVVDDVLASFYAK